MAFYVLSWLTFQSFQFKIFTLNIMVLFDSDVRLFCREFYYFNTINVTFVAQPAFIAKKANMV